MITPTSNNNVNIYANHVSTRNQQPSNTPALPAPEAQAAATVEISQQAVIAQQASAPMAAMAVTNTASANPTSSNAHAIMILARTNEIMQGRYIAAEGGRPSFYHGANQGETQLFYDFARDHLGIQDSQVRQDFGNEVFGNLWSSDASVRQATFFAMEHLATANISDVEEAAQFLADVRTNAFAGQMFWEQGYMVRSHVRNDDGTITQQPHVRPISEDVPSWYVAGEHEAMRAERENITTLAFPIFFHHSPDTFQEDWVNILANDGRQNAADAVQRIFDIANSGQAPTAQTAPPQVPPTPEPPPAAPTLPPYTPAPPSAPAPPATNNNNAEQQLISTFGDVEQLTWNNMSQDSRNLLVNAFDVRLQSHENRLQFQALFTQMSIQYNPAFRDAVNNGTLSFQGDLADRLTRLGVDLPSTTAPTTPEAPEAVTAQTEAPQAITTAEGFNLNFRDLMEQQNAMLLEMFRNLNQNNDNMEYGPIMQILAAHNLA